MIGAARPARRRCRRSCRRRGARAQYRPVAGLARQPTPARCASTVRSRSRTSIRRPASARRPRRPQRLRASSSTSAPIDDGAARLAAHRWRPDADRRARRDCCASAPWSTAWPCWLRPTPSRRRARRPSPCDRDLLGTEALFTHADGSFWRRHFTVALHAGRHRRHRLGVRRRRHPRPHLARLGGDVKADVQASGLRAAARRSSTAGG